MLMIVFFCLGFKETSFIANRHLLSDTVPPIGSIIINNNAGYTNSILVNLDLSASDEGSGVDSMRFSNDSISWSPWEEYVPWKSWTLTSGDGLKTVYVQYRDTSGNLSIPYSDQIILDTAPPNISNVISPDTININDTLLLSLTVTENYSIKEVLVFYRGGGETNFSWGSAMFESGFWRYTLPYSSIKGFEYYIEAYDSAGNLSRKPETGCYSLRVRINDPGEWERNINDELVPLPSGTAQTNYRIVSFPLTRDNPSALDLFEKNLGEYEPSKWRVGQYKGEDNVYINEPGIGSIKPGEAFFVIVKDPNKVLLSGAGTTIRTDTIFKKELLVGWNMLGNPFPFQIPVSAITLDNGEDVTIYSYEGSWSIVNTLKPWKGYVIRVTSETYINIDPTIRVKTVKEDLDLGRYIKIIARCEDALDDYNFIGFSENSKDEWDRKDKFEPPLLGKYISLYFPHYDWDRYSGRYTTDIRKEGNQRFDFEVITEIVNDVRLNFEFNGIEKNTPVLVDRDNGDIIRFKEKDDYVYRNNGFPRHFSLILGDEGYIEREIKKAINIVELDVNPITFSTINIRYFIDVDGEIEISIYDCAGRKVERLLKNKVKRGEGYISGGNNLRAGVYFVRMSYFGKNITRKVLKVR